MNWYLGPIDSYLEDIKKLFSKNINHKHAQNYLKYPLFNYTKFSRMAWDNDLIYYSAGIERPEYNGSIRIMSRHTRCRKYDFGTRYDDLMRGLITLDESTQYALNIGYKDIWISREESPKLLEYFSKNSRYNWSVSYEQIPGSGSWATNQYQYILRFEQ